MWLGFHDPTLEFLVYDVVVDFHSLSRTKEIKWHLGVFSIGGPPFSERQELPFNRSLSYTIFHGSVACLPLKSLAELTISAHSTRLRNLCGLALGFWGLKLVRPTSGKTSCVLSGYSFTLRGPTNSIAYNRLGYELHSFSAALVQYFGAI